MQSGPPGDERPGVIGAYKMMIKPSLSCPTNSNSPFDLDPGTKRVGTVCIPIAHIFI